MKNLAPVLTTVNAPYCKQLSAQELAHCLSSPVDAKAVPGHMSTFFGEVEPNIQLAFADSFGIPATKLAQAAKAFAEYSGENYPLAM
jgi:hypothetical protein